MRTIRTILVYIGSVLVAIALFVLIRSHGETLTPPATGVAVNSVPGGAASTDIFWHLLLALAAVVALGRLLGWLFSRIGQPPVIGEVVGGILLGPSLLGHIAPAAYHYILPAAVAPYLGIIAQFGIILYMFLIGLHLNTDLLRSRIQATVATSHASIVVPFLFGSALALYLYPEFATREVPFTNFALFLGLAMSITAFPVLARILSDLGLTRTELGTIALTCASVDDVTAWCLLAFVVGVVQSTGQSALMIAGFTIAFILFLFVVVRPVAARLIKAEGENLSQTTIAAALVSMLAAALITEAIGIHAIFGAFLLGSVIPHDSKLARALTHSLEDLVTILLLPAFFAFTGMRTEIALVSGVEEWLIVGLIIAVATVGKFGGTILAARLTGLGWKPAAVLGVLMNTRGLMELIVLNVGLELGVISQKLFTMMVLMALVTTIATTPILRRLSS